jgi:rhamnosyltransferase
MNESVCAVIVSYNAPAELSRCINSITRQVREVLVIDNGSSAAAKEHIKKMQLPGKTACAFNSRNMGLGFALNQGLKYSIDNEHRWTLLLDQDSIPANRMVQEMLMSYQRLTPDEHARCAVIVPVVIDADTGKEIPSLITTPLLSKRVRRPGRDIFVHFHITSGSLIRNDTLCDIGFMDEHYFIDYVDYDFCFKAIGNGFNILMSKNALLHHSIAMRKSALFFHYREHGPERLYYQTRNRLLTLTRYGKSHRSFLYEDVGRFLGKLLKVVLFESSKREKIQMVFRGIRDFVKYPDKFMKG